MSAGGEQAARAARNLIRSASRGALATLGRDGGAPYASLVLVATTQAAEPLLFLSGLAEHSRNLAKDARASLLLDTGEGLENPLTAPRVMIQGRIERSDDARHRARYLARHPAAGLYAGLGDFAIYRLAAEQIHLVAGFGQARWLRADAVLDGHSPDLEAAEAEIVAGVNRDPDRVAKAALRRGGRALSGWRACGVDAEGCDLASGVERLRLDFATRAETADQAAKLLDAALA